MTNLMAVQNYGQSLWLNYLRRAFIESGQLKEALNCGITGITFNPMVFEKAITCSADYDGVIYELVRQGMPVKEIYQALLADDVQKTADVLRLVFDESSRVDGYVTIELNPSLAEDTTSIIGECRHILHQVNRANVMVEIPATPAGIAAMESLTSDGVNINATHIFSLETYEKVAKAYLTGIEKYVETHSVWRQYPASVASISISRIDRLVDSMLVESGRPQLTGKAGISVAKKIYRRFHELFNGPEWQSLADRGAQVQRPKWTRTTPHRFDYPDTFYIDSLIGPGTVNTLSQASFVAFRDHGQASLSLTENLAVAEAHLNTLIRLGIQPDQIGAELQRQSLADSQAYYQAIINSVAKKREELEGQWQRMAIRLGADKEPVERALQESAEGRLMCRVWDHDQTVWGQVPPITSDPLGWLHIIEIMRENVPDLDAFTQSVVSDGLTKAVIVGMGGSSLLTRLFVKAFTPWIDLHNPLVNRLELMALDTISGESISALTRHLDPAKTMFVISSKSGETAETISLFKYLYHWIVKQVGQERAGSHFVAITNPKTSLAAIANEHQFRRAFLDNPAIKGHFSALSYTGLVPASLLGVDIKGLLGRAQAMACNAHGCNQAVSGDNLAERLGTTLGVLARSGRNKLMLSSSPLIHDLDDWVERIIAGSCGKAGRGIVPVTGELFEPGTRYSADRVFTYHLLDEDEAAYEQVAMAAAVGHPTITIKLKDVYDLGGLLFMWQMAAAVAAHHLAVNPFNQPDLDNSKRLAGQMMEVYSRTGRLPEQETTALSAAELQRFIESSQPGGYIAIQAFLQESDDVIAALQKLRLKLARRTGLVVTLGFGPRFLHRTGQLHKGGSSDGLFIQLTADTQEDLAIPDLDGGRGLRLTFGAMLQAQALGDALALRQARRRFIHFNLGQDVLGGLATLTRSVEEPSPVLA